MLPVSNNAWQLALKDLITDPHELASLLQLPKSALDQLIKQVDQFPLRIPRQLLTRMMPGHLDDPLLKQFLPTRLEFEKHDDYIADPLAETKANPLPGLLHKYHGRVLLTLTSACAVHCRYCFRRYFPYTTNNPGKRGWQAIFNYIAADVSIAEVILSGGDPLTLSDAMLSDFLSALADIAHVNTLRLHTRIPVVLPERITSQFLMLSQTLRERFHLVMVIHTNHANELATPEVTAALTNLRTNGFLLLNQSVLLKDINDDPTILADLSRALLQVGVLPYYLHILDKVQGTQHFDIPLDRAKTIHSQLCNQLPGYLVPKLVIEQAGAPAKSQL